MTKTDELLKEFAEIIEARLIAEQRKHRELDWIKIASKKIARMMVEKFAQVEEERMPKREPITWNQVKEKYLEFHKIDAFTENMAIDIDFGYWLVNSSRLTKDGAKASQKTEGGEG